MMVGCGERSVRFRPPLNLTREEVDEGVDIIAPKGKLPLNTNGGGLSYMHSGMYGMYALQEGVRQMRGVSDAQIEGAEISVVHGVGSMFGAAGTIVLTAVSHG